MTICISENVQKLISDKKFHDSVTQLLGKFNESKMTDSDWSTWQESRDFASTLGMAAVARSDYVVLMHDLWDEIWDESVRDLGDKDLNDYLSPKQIWDGKTQFADIPLRNFDSRQDIWARFCVHFRMHRDLELPAESQLTESGLCISMIVVDEQGHQVEKYLSADGWTQCKSVFSDDFKFFSSAKEKLVKWDWEYIEYNYPFCDRIVKPTELEGGIDSLKAAATALVNALRSGPNA